MEKKLIQFTGAQSTGKSTVALALLDKFPGQSIFIGETTRRLKELGVLGLYDVEAGVNEQMLINAELMYQMYYGLGLQSINWNIAERSAICCLAYARQIQKTVDTPAYNHMIDFTERFLRASVYRTDVQLFTFFFDIDDLTFTDDAFRLKYSRERVNNEIKSILTEFKIPHIVVPAGTIAQRTNFIYNTVMSKTQESQ